MRMLRELLIVVVAMAIVGLAGKAWGAECYHSAAAVRADHAGAWPSWTLRSPGHAGLRCWFPTERKVMHESSAHVHKHDTPSYAATPAPSASVGVPIPRAMPFELTKERTLEELIPFNERWAGLYVSWR